MPWNECSVMDERLRFVAKLLDGEAMTNVCREFGISRKTGKSPATPPDSSRHEEGLADGWLCRSQHEFDLYRFERELNRACRVSAEHTRVKQCFHIAMHGLYVPTNTPRCLTN
jgi:hypothetical protein